MIEKIKNSDILRFIFKESLLVSLAVLAFQFLPSKIENALFNKRKKPPTVHHLKEHQKSFKHYKNKANDLSEEYSLTPPSLKFVSQKRRHSYFLSSSNEIKFDTKDVYKPHGDFIFYHEYAHFLQHSGQLPRIDPSFIFYLGVLIYFLALFHFRKSPLKSLGLRILIPVLIFGAYKKSIMLNEFEADTWAYSKLKSHKLYPKYRIFVSGSKSSANAKNNFGLLSWLALTHPDFKTRKNIHLYLDLNPLEVLIIDFKNHYSQNAFFPPKKIMVGDSGD